MSGKGLSCIEFSLTDRNAVVILEADGIIFALVGEVEIKKVMPVEKLLPPAALMDTDQDFFLQRSGPAEHFFFFASNREVMVGPV